jgi:hypothetical protein
MDAETTAGLFELAIMGETATREFYEGLAKKFSHEANIAKFWNSMAADEIADIKMLQDLKKSLTPPQLSAAVDREIFEMAFENSKIRIVDVLAMVKNLNDAYVLAQLWENSEIYRVFEFITAKFIQGSADGRFVRIHLMSHRKKLETFLLAFGDPEERKNIRALDPEPSPAG